MKTTKFSPGQRWYCDRSKEGKVSFWFVIMGPPKWSHNNPKTHKLCRIEADTRAVAENPNTVKYLQERCFGHDTETDYSHAHLKKYATWEQP